VQIQFSAIPHSPESLAAHRATALHVYIYGFIVIPKPNANYNLQRCSILVTKYIFTKDKSYEAELSADLTRGIRIINYQPHADRWRAERPLKLGEHHIDENQR
jgi:hypothetical protein